MKMILVGIGNAWCAIPVSFNKKKMALNASGCCVRSVTKHHVTCIPELHRIYYSFDSEDVTFVQTAQILPKTVIITCDLVEFHSPEVQVARV